MHISARSSSYTLICCHRWRQWSRKKRHSELLRYIHALYEYNNDIECENNEVENCNICTRDSFHSQSVASSSSAPQ